MRISDWVQTCALPISDGPAAEISTVAAADLPPGIRDAVLARVPGMTIAEAERKERDGKIFYDVEGTRPDGSPVELDLIEEAGAWRVVEMQRDIAWADAPAPVDRKSTRVHSST